MLAVGGFGFKAEVIQQVVVLSLKASKGQPKTKIVQPWRINGVVTDRYDACQIYRLW